MILHVIPGNEANRDRADDQRKAAMATDPGASGPRLNCEKSRDVREF
jgi:hypothetical protein